ncbi:solute carrier family 25 member 46 [Hermetia illucens]|uniref:solute carrier family 25 member 46 n=1 Tax=Hermetia illucens TaxID=343691 RepID=UPI0018CC51E6|nr:solute carrier family 25 member 46 [Hermetia illucens]
MAGIEQYSNLMYANEDDDQLDEISARYAYESINPHGTEPNYRYVNSERDLTLPLQKHRNIQSFYESPEDDISIRKYLGVSVGIVSLITENLLSHPFVVLRRQCQVHHSSRKYHLQPFTLIPTLIHLHQRQGVTTLWKGLGSCLLVRGMSLAVEDVISKVTPWPKEVHNKTSMKQFGQHILLKCISIAVVMPFYSASLVETVQSDIASEKPGVFDVFREGAGRLLSWSAPQKGRMLPVWALLGPSVSLGISKYMFSLIMKGITSRVMRYKWSDTQEQKGAKPRDLTSVNQDIEIYSTLVSVVTSEILFYPFETILHRIQLQGTRTIIDNLDNGYAVVPIMTSYEGAIDCYRSTIASEGVGGLYKGFGAILLQFAAHIAVIKIAKWVVTQVTEILSNKPPSKIVEYYNLDRSTGLDTMGGGANLSNSTTVSRSLSSLSGIE